MNRNSFTRHRPPLDARLGDKRLPKLIGELTTRLAQAQVELEYETLYLPAKAWAEVAQVLVEFGEDLHNDIGLWRSFEQLNQRLFGTPLPLTLPPGQTPTLPDQIAHLLWGLYSELNPDLTLAPTHQDLRHLAEVSADFLEQRMKDVPQRSSVKDFLTRRDRYGWDIKRKLVWLGWHSYLFRHSCARYIAEQDEPASISLIDDFICQQTTIWSGLGPLDLLAQLLPLSEAERAELLSWSLRHLAYYRITAVERNGLTAINLLTDQPYSVRMETPGESFAVGHVVFGSLVPWHKAWYWSGEQRRFNALTESQLAEVLDSFARSAAQAIYRYDQARLAQAKETLARLHRHFLDHFGDELVVFPDGLTMAAAMQKFQRQYNEALLAEQPEIDSDRFDSDSAQPQMPYPPEIIDNENGVAVFFNPEEGTEMMVHFNDVIRALQKNGVGLDEDDNEALRGLLESPALSPQFVRRLVKAHGEASIAAAYLIREPKGQPVLDYLLRRTKGHFFRTRYPEVTVV